jgi:hypothetical protein
MLSTFFFRFGCPQLEVWFVYAVVDTRRIGRRSVEEQPPQSACVMKSLSLCASVSALGIANEMPKWKKIPMHPSFRMCCS